MLRRRLPFLARPIYVRLLSHASLMVDEDTQEASMLETFETVLNALPGDESPIFWDVGANIGVYTWKCALTRPDSHIVSFEPDQRNLRCLTRTSDAWVLPNHTIMPVAVAEKSGRAGFSVDDLAGATGTLQCHEESFNKRHYGLVPRKIEVETIALDDFSRGRSLPGVVKIDVEGAELRVVEGATKMLAEHRPVLFFESFGRGAEMLKVLSPLGYVAWDTDKKRVVTPETVNFVALVPQARPKVMEALGRLGYPTYSSVANVR